MTISAVTLGSKFNQVEHERRIAPRHCFVADSTFACSILHPVRAAPYLNSAVARITDIHSSSHSISSITIYPSRRSAPRMSLSCMLATFC